MKLGWETEPTGHSYLYEGMIGSALVLGMAIGALAGGKLMGIGRRTS